MYRTSGDLVLLARRSFDEGGSPSKNFGHKLILPNFLILARFKNKSYHNIMAELKTKVTKASVKDFIDKVPDKTKKHDSLVLLKLFQNITGEKPKMWGTSIIGFGQYHYKSERSSQEGDWMLTGFSPRKQNLTLYIMLGFADYSDLLGKLGKHKTSGGSCLYINKLSEVDIKILEQLIKKSYLVIKKKYKV